MTGWFTWAGGEMSFEAYYHGNNLVMKFDEEKMKNLKVAATIGAILLDDSEALAGILAAGGKFIFMPE